MNAIGSFVYGVAAILLLAFFGYTEHKPGVILCAVLCAALAWLSAYAAALIEEDIMDHPFLEWVAIVSLVAAVMIFIGALVYVS